MGTRFDSRAVLGATASGEAADDDGGKHQADAIGEYTTERLCRGRGARVYELTIERLIAKASIATVPLQKVRATDLEAFHAGLKLSASSVTVCHAVIGRALKLAVGIPVHVVAERRGHEDVKQTLEVYAHALPDMAARCGRQARDPAGGRSLTNRERTT